MSSNILPYGENLKSLLIQQQLSESYINSILKSKGIYIGNKNKSVTVPILSACLLTPSEYNDIKEHRSEKESSTKQKTEKLNGKINEKLEDIIPDIDITQLCQPDFNEYTFIGLPSISTVNGNQDHLILEYKIKTNNLLDSWTEREKEFEGSIEFKKSSDGIDVAIAESYHTSRHTNDINRKYLSAIKQVLRDKGKISKEDTKVLFSSFTNEARILFLWSMTSKIKPGNVSFERITDIDLKVDDTLQIPNSSEITWMKDQIKRLHINGDTLQNLNLISTPAYYPYLIIWKIDALFNFDLLNSQGNFRASFYFSNYPKNSNAEFEIELTGISLDSGSKDSSKLRIKKEIYRILGDLKLKNFNP